MDTLLSVPQYDFNWQHIYQLSEPLPLSDVGSITADVVFDNSSENPFNPDPSKYVTWGDQTWEEMAIGFFDVSVPRNPAANEIEQKTPAAIKADAEAEQVKQRKIEAKIDKTVTAFFERFDANKDGTILKDELPLALQSKRAYLRFDTDGKPGLSAEEIADQARRRFEKRE